MEAMNCKAVVIRQSANSRKLFPYVQVSLDYPVSGGLTRYVASISESSVRIMRKLGQNLSHVGRDSETPSKPDWSLRA
jgi:hypothetical protein